MVKRQFADLHDRRSTRSPGPLKTDITASPSPSQRRIEVCHRCSIQAMPRPISQPMTLPARPPPSAGSAHRAGRERGSHHGIEKHALARTLVAASGEKSAGFGVPVLYRSGASRPMKMGTIASPWRYDAAAADAIRLDNLRRTAVLRYASWAGCLFDFAGGSVTLRSRLFRLRKRRDRPISDFSGL